MKKALIFFVAYLLLLNTAFSQAGKLDKTFGINGVSTIYLYGNPVVKSMLVQKDGKIVVCTDKYILRFESDGKLDSTFGFEGIIVSEYILACMGQQKDGKIVVCGTSKSGYTLSRFDKDGVLDANFGSAGAVSSSLSEVDEPVYLIVEQDDNIIVAGTSAYIASEPLAWGQLLRFEKNGEKLLNKKMFELGYNHPFTISQLHDGRIYLSAPIHYTLGHMRMTLYNSSFELDTSFNHTGNYVFTDNLSFVSSLAQRDGKILLGGVYYSKTTLELKVYRFNPDGYLDLSFGNSGSLTLDSIKINGNKPVMIEQPDGKIIVGYQADLKGVLYRFNVNGNVDKGYGVDGKSVNTIVSNFKVGALALQSDGKILAAGNSLGKNGYEISVARYNQDILSSIKNPLTDIFSFTVYPNPMKNKVNIEYYLPKEAKVTLRLVDLQGKEVKKIVDNEKQFIGSHRFEIEIADKIPKGNYFLILSAGEQQQVVKVFKD
ncbi:MAG: T9SS type A sorting domain-containing protein [Flavobacteriales bacterium]|nr:T9SS type A sorting domain-containing protein [Flavobacteriales bacterium]